MRLVSIILPVYNCERFVAQSINSIISQSYHHWELLICDDGSTDASYNILTQFKDKRIRLFKNERNQGSLLTRNLLLHESKGEYITFQDADDLSEPERIISQLAVFTDPEMMLCGTWARYFINTRTVSIKKTPADWADIKEYYKTKNPFCSASIMFRRKVIEELGVLRKYFFDKGNYDYDFTSRIVERYRSCNIQKSLYNVRILPDSNSRHINCDRPLKFESHKIVQFLIEERETKLRDSLMSGDLALLKNLEETLLEPYKTNKLLAYDKQINKLMDSELYFSALKLSLKVILIHKFSIQSIRLFLYSVKRYILSI